MKAIFAAMNLEDGVAPVPPSISRRSSAADMALANRGEGYTASNEAQHRGSFGGGDTYALGFDDGRGFWGSQQGGGAYGIPKP